MNREFAVDDARAVIAAERERLRLLADHAAARGQQFEFGLNQAGAAAASLVHLLERHAPIRLLTMVVEVFRESFLAPEIQAVDVAVREVERTLVRLEAAVVLRPRRHFVPHRIAARYDGALRAP